MKNLRFSNCEVVTVIVKYCPVLLSIPTKNGIAILLVMSEKTNKQKNIFVSDSLLVVSGKIRNSVLGSGFLLLFVIVNCSN